MLMQNKLKNYRFEEVGKNGEYKFLLEIYLPLEQNFFEIMQKYSKDYFLQTHPLTDEKYVLFILIVSKKKLKSLCNIFSNFTFAMAECGSEDKMIENISKGVVGFLNLEKSP